MSDGEAPCSNLGWLNEKMDFIQRIADLKVEHLREVNALRAELIAAALVTAEAVSTARFALIKWAIGTLIFLLLGIAGLVFPFHR